MSQTADRSSQDVPLRGGSVSPRRLLGALREITLAAMHAHTPTEVALVAATQVCQLMECDEAVVRWWNPERASLELLADTRPDRTGRAGRADSRTCVSRQLLVLTHRDTTRE